MAFNGLLIKVGQYIIPQEYIAFDSYDVSREVLDIDSYRDSNGVLHRSALSHVPVKINFKVKSGLSNAQVGALFKGISTNYTNSNERKASVTAYVPETDEYITQDMYIAGPKLKMRKVTNSDIIYDEFEMKFIGY